MVVRLVSLVVCGAIGVGLAGCGGSALAPVTGKIKYNQQPVAGAAVTFAPTEGPLATGVTDASGQYELSTGGQPGAAPGKYRVGVAKFSPSSGGPANPTPDDMMKMMKEKTLPTAKPELPAKFAAPQTSGFEANVTSDKSKNVFDFDLKD